jgi:hypothetical protein
MNEIIVTRPNRLDALYVVAHHLDSFTTGLTDSQVLGYLLASEGECPAGYTVRGAVYYEDNEADMMNNFNNEGNKR